MKFDDSKALFERSRKSLAGGVSSNVRATASPPLFYVRGKGSRLWDADGNEFIDYVLARGPLMLGHSPAPVIAAVKKALDTGLMYAAQNTYEIAAAEKVQKHVPCAELVRFSCTGSEAVHAALRLARAATGRTKIVKFEGHYHGWFDGVFFNTGAKVEASGPREAPVAVPMSAGVLRSDGDHLILLPWNDFDLVRKTFAARGSEIAAVITEPVMCNNGGILPKPGFLQGLRDLCSSSGSLLVFDEVITGFRIAMGGAQSHFGVVPDLATFAKAIAGGYAVSALAGKKAYMDLIATRAVSHAGTYNSNPPAMAAAVAAIEMLEANDGEIHKRLHRTGRALMEGIEAASMKAGVPVTCRGLGPMFHVGIGEKGDITDYRSYQNRDAAAYGRFAAALQENGVRVIPEGLWFVSAAHTEQDVEETLKAVDKALPATRT